MCNVLDREVVTEKEGFIVWRANGWILVSFPPFALWSAGHSTCTITVIFL